MALPVDSFTLAMVGIAPANTASTGILHGCRSQKLVIKWVVSFCTVKSESKRQEFLTRACVVLDPLQELFLREVTEFSYDAPLILQVGESLNCHDGQYSHDCHLKFKLLSYPAKQLQMKSQKKQNISEYNRIFDFKAFAKSALLHSEYFGVRWWRKESF